MTVRTSFKSGTEEDKSIIGVLQHRARGIGNNGVAESRNKGRMLEETFKHISENYKKVGREGARLDLNHYDS